jgi:uncharacterized Zn finger protein
MPLIITPTDRTDITRIVCPECKEKVHLVGLLKGSKIDGLTFRCKRCGRFWSVKSE